MRVFFHNSITLYHLIRVINKIHMKTPEYENTFCIIVIATGNHR